MIPADTKIERLARPAAHGWLRLLSACNELGIGIHLTETVRSRERQAELYAQGRTAPGAIVTWAPPGEGPHELDVNGEGWAIDFCFDGDKPYSDIHPWLLVGMMAESLGFHWGGRNSPKKLDRPHLQWPR